MRERVPSKVADSHYGQIKFYDDFHTYELNGQILPSVSKIMAEVSKDYYAEIPLERLEKAAERGTRVHQSVEYYELYGWDAPDDIKGFLTSYKAVKRIKKFEPLHHEIMLTNGEYCGTLDMIAEMNGTVIIDLKATAKFNKELVEIQLAAYEELAKANGYTIKGSYCLHLKENSGKLIEVIPNYEKWEELKQSYFERRMYE